MARDSYPIARRDTWVKDATPHLFVQELSAGATPVDLLAGSKLTASPGFAGRSTGDGGEDLEPVWPAGVNGLSLPQPPAATGCHTSRRSRTSTPATGEGRRAAAVDLGS